MTIEQLIPVIVKALKKISPWPWQTAKAGFDLALVEARDASFIASFPLWLAQMVVGMVEERGNAKYRGGHNWESAKELVFHDFGISPEDYEWLKEKVGE